MFGIPNQFPTSLILIVTGIWATFTFAVRNNDYLKLIKSKAYSQAIAAAEEIHEDYFLGVPPEYADDFQDGWIRSRKGWIRDSSWVRSDRYVRAARDMNQALALIAIHSPQSLTEKAFELENIAVMPRGDNEREQKMNELVSLMKKDLRKIWGKKAVKQSWY